MADDTELLAALAVIQARGAIGERSLAGAVSHADRFVELVPTGCRSLVDLGSGGGLPALVIAWRRPDVSVTMVERRATRADLLRRAVTSLGMLERTTVVNDDVAAVATELPHAFERPLELVVDSFEFVHNNGLLVQGSEFLVRGF